MCTTDWILILIILFFIGCAIENKYEDKNNNDDNYYDE